jgi:toxin ParE1/3/4
MRELVFTPDAGTDFRGAFRWYEQRRAGIGLQFEAAFDSALDRIRTTPLASKAVTARFRCVVLRRFPYSIFFAFNDKRVTVVAVWHTRQDPDTLLQRLRPF